MGVLDILNPITSLIKPAADLVDSLHTSGEEKGQLELAKAEINNALVKLQFEMASQVISYQVKAMEAETKLKDAQRDIIVSEAKSDSWLTKSWRPLIMVLFGGIICYGYIAKTAGLPAAEIQPEMWTLLQLGVGGYIGARSAEKIVPKVLEVIRETGKK